MITIQAIILLWKCPCGVKHGLYAIGQDMPSLELLEKGFKLDIENHKASHISKEAMVNG